MTIIGVAGLGVMGRGIAQVFAAAGFSVHMTDTYVPALDGARDQIAKALQDRVNAGKLALEAMQEALARLYIVDGLGNLAKCDMVIEAIIEDKDAKITLTRALEAVLRPDAVICTNTSSIPVHQIAAGLARPERLLALHFFNPPTAMKLVELAPHASTSAGALTLARMATEAAGKRVVQCPDRPGFVVNRCARPYYGEALAMLGEGHAPGAIDAAMQAAGYPLGPFSLIDLIGADINLAATKGLASAMGGHPRYHIFPALTAQLAKGDLGRKTGRGFVFPDPLPASPPDAPAIQARIEATLINEAHFLLAEGGVSAPDIDIAMRLGLNFPRGPFEALALHDRAAVLATLAALQSVAPPELKDRYTPAPGLASGP
jgi:3-hydroxybutyryl-CoA dehydrogenase